MGNAKISLQSLILLLFFCLGCKEQKPSVPGIHYKLLSSSKTGVDFSNIIDLDNVKNPLNYINAFNGGGVAISDLNNDGLQDIVFTGNMVPSKIYYNQGGMKFKDVTEEVGFVFDGWPTGVVIADVNNDGLNDIYICRSYDDDPKKRANLLFVNSSSGKFVEQGVRYGLNDENYSIGASFFDYDLDGDLDLIVANHPRYRLIALSKHLNYFKNPVKNFSSRLFRNVNGRFVDVTEGAGLLSYGFCLSVTTSDFNNDNYPDIFITVDHDEEDFLFLNNGDGSFNYSTHAAFKQVSRSSMGVDISDINHDLNTDIMVAEMLPGEYYREKISMSMQTIQRFNFLIDTMGYKYYQMRNFLHLNNGNGTFSDVSQLAGIHKSDWSWSNLFVDADNDMDQDIFIANGYYKDIFNKDLKKAFDKKMMELKGDMTAMNKLANEYAKSCPIDDVPNVFYENQKVYKYNNISEKAGFTKPTISTGAAYGDLDNDGDIDIVTNNIGEKADIYENKLAANNYIRLSLRLEGGSTAWGSKAIIYVGDEKRIGELTTTRGYQSSSEPIIHFGLGTNTLIDSIDIIWLGGSLQKLESVKSNQVLEIQKSNSLDRFSYPVYSPVVQNIEAKDSGLDFVQKENYGYDDYKDQVLLPHKLSEQGPFLSVDDVNNDGLQDVYVSAPKGQAGALYIQDKKGKFNSRKIDAFAVDKMYEDGGSSFVDVDNDGDLDLIIASSGYEFPENDPLYQVRLYLNNGKGYFTKDNKNLPAFRNPVSCVVPSDIDNDGDMDFFLGGAYRPKKYPYAGHSAIFVNDGKGQFSVLSTPDLSSSGMIKDAIWFDVNNDDRKDLIVVGEWTSIEFWINEASGLVNRSEEYLDEQYKGWWNVVKVSDIDNDGLEDIIVGNLGLNYKYKATKEKPFKVYGKDMDENGNSDIILSTFYDDVEYPVRGRSCSVEQIPELADSFKTFHDFSLTNLENLYGSELNEALKLDANHFASTIFFQNSPNNFVPFPLPVECQMAPINDIIIDDINNDGKKDLIVGGNLYQSEIETGRADAGTGRVLINLGDRKFNALSVQESGLYISGDVKCLESIDLGKSKRKGFLVGNNRGPLELLEISERSLR